MDWIQYDMAESSVNPYDHEEMKFRVERLEEELVKKVRKLEAASIHLAEALDNVNSTLLILIDNKGGE